MENILAVVNLYVLLTLHHVQKTSIQFFQIYIKNHKIRGPSVKVLGIASENKSDDALNWREEEEEQVFGNQSRHKTSTAKSCFELYMFWPKNNIFSTFSPKNSVQKSMYYFLVYFWTKCLPMSKRFRIWWAILICTDLGSPKNCYFDFMTSSEFWIFGSFWHFQGWNVSKNHDSKPQNDKNDDFWPSKTSHSPPISRKIGGE